MSALVCALAHRWREVMCIGWRAQLILGLLTLAALCHVLATWLGP